MHRAEVKECLIPAELAGQRFDQALARLFPEYSRTRLTHWVRDGRVLLDERSPRPRDLVMAGQRVRLMPLDEPVAEITPEQLPLDVVYQDAALIIVNKPAHLVVHPGAGNRSGTLQNALLAFAPELVSVPRCGIVHRLDKDTSGLLAVARSIESHTRLVVQLAARRFEREYEAVVNGVMTGGGTVDAPIARHGVDRKRMSVRAGGRRAVTHYRVIKRFRAHTHVSVRLETGRTHQIRVHLAHIHHPLVGDPVYSRRLLIPADAADSLSQSLRGFKRQALHARRLGLEHPITGEFMRWEAPLPADMQSLLQALDTDLRQHVRDAR
ncbi:MAG: 23S rRNA pseudouridine(1911/1915/1917) synthase RluD [Gammaproteobacteria bacterium]|nr:23S rRNA pseudouridine(1911/1915/1917) synthase RluD [Gammaproteobacteria bacterium]MDE2346077.1 23S rRNA pseudouridine(1911/1915/1917) synthase RluD [Gammaproteobacteria bacterium]